LRSPYRRRLSFLLNTRSAEEENRQALVDMQPACSSHAVDTVVNKKQ